MIIKRYKCNKCEKIRKHIDMHDKDICYDCWEAEQDKTAESNQSPSSNALNRKLEKVVPSQDKMRGTQSQDAFTRKNKEGGDTLLNSVLHIPNTTPNALRGIFDTAELIRLEYLRTKYPRFQFSLFLKSRFRQNSYQLLML